MVTPWGGEGLVIKAGHVAGASWFWHCCISWPQLCLHECSLNTLWTVHTVFGVYFSHMMYFIPIKISSERICDGYVPIIVQRKAISVLYLISCKGFCFCLNMSLTRKWEVLLHCLANNHSNEAPLFLELKFWQGEGTDINNHRSTTYLMYQLG